MAGDAKEGAAIGAIVGGILGLGVGAFAALEERGDSVEGCLRGKGYAPSGGLMAGARTPPRSNLYGLTKTYILDDHTRAGGRPGGEAPHEP